LLLILESRVGRFELKPFCLPVTASRTVADTCHIVTLYHSTYTVMMSQG